MTTRFTGDGKKVSLLGYGAMRLPTVDGGHACNWWKGASDADIDQPRLNRQIRQLFDGGVNYFDTSPAYCRGRSESALGEALAASGRERGEYFIATKLSNFAVEQYSLAAAQAMFDHSLKALKTDYIDNYLLHNIGKGGFETFSKRYLENGAAEWCLKLRDAGKIRNLGFSFHGDRRAWDWCIKEHGRFHWDFAQIQLNYVDWHHAAEVNPQNVNAQELYDELTALKIPVVVMEPLLGGRLARYNWSVANELAPLDPEATPAEWSLRFCGSHPNVMTVLSGMTFDEHIEENCRIFSSFRPCTAAEFAALERAAIALVNCHQLPCTRCNYCMPCPYGLDIPALFAFRNEFLTEDRSMDAKRLLSAYRRAVPEELRRADHCTLCGRCRTHCPQLIDIPKEMAALDAVIDELKAEVAR